MSWIRYSDDFLDDPAVLSLGDDEAIAFLEYHRLVAWSGKHLTDGEIPISAMRRVDATALAALVRVGLLEARDDGAGWLPRFLDRVDEHGHVVYGHHPSRQFVEERRTTRAEAGRKGGQASAQAKAKARAEANAEAPAQPPYPRSPRSTEIPGTPKDSPPPPSPTRRGGGSNQRALGGNPRALGTAPRDLGDSPRQEREATKRAPTRLGDLLREVARRDQTSLEELLP